MGWNFFLALNNRLNHFFRAASLPFSSPPFQVFILNKMFKASFFSFKPKDLLFFSIFKFSYHGVYFQSKEKTLNKKFPEDKILQKMCSFFLLFF